MVALIRRLSRRPAIVHAPSERSVKFNISIPDDEFFRFHLDVDWTIFDTVITSHELDIRLPNPGLLKRVLAQEERKITPHDTVYVGHDSGNVLAAWSFGFLIADFKEARRGLRNIGGDFVRRG